MKPNMTWRPVAFVAGLMMVAAGPRGLACCAVSGGCSHVVNADQTVIMLWDEARQTQHFIRKADFKTDAKDVGFLVPSPSRPQLAESSNAAFAKLAEITAPPVSRGGGIPLGCSVAAADAVFLAILVAGVVLPLKRVWRAPSPQPFPR